MGTGFQLTLMLSNDFDSAVKFSGGTSGADRKKKIKQQQLNIFNWVNSRLGVGSLINGSQNVV